MEADRSLNSTGFVKQATESAVPLNKREEDLCVDVFRNIMRARHVMYNKAAEVADESGLHAAELNVVDILGKFGPISMGRLSRETFISPSNTTSTVKKLEQSGLVRRRKSHDSDREVIVSLTASGEQTFRKCYPRVLGEVHAHLSERLTPAQLTQLQKMLARLVG